ncbi:phytoene desaturase family protein [Cellulomonas marina]|uniref:Pyridine nucleotide-disulfide oxidoreductase domain-containing protein 2 n=1 Tax=Cellulomonas marina TaxID=988821 RepID=A0A1I0Z6N0_9CELL|nr:NAD(P)/FAD-dependent oxidoreductase [Cellulomonas marina]GIG28226.1 dehydrogenase [Cellulomonas marina]SFB20230.1 Phytoene dehydrogenase-related protein [Cellulomonas marina]
MQTVDAVVIGAGPNGLVAANALVDAGWDVLVLEAQPEVGGAVRTAEVLAPGYRTDLFSAFYPLAAASPIVRGLHLEDHGLRWVHAPDVLAHALDDGRTAVLHQEASDTAAGLEGWGDGDGQAWLDLVEQWDRVRDPLLDALFTPIPPVKAVARILGRTGVGGALDLARLALLPVRRLADESFRGQGGGLLLTGNAMHADIPPDAAGSGLFGWLLAMLGQDVGFPVPEHGAGSLADALARRVRAGSGSVRTGERVVRVHVRGGRAIGVETAGGERIAARRAVLADVTAPSLYGRLVEDRHLPERLKRDVARFQWDHPTFKVNWALDRPIPWRSPQAAGAGTVHLGVDMDGFVDYAADLSTGRPPERPFLLVGQMTTADPTRSPAGTESVWAYTHLPHGGTWDAAATAAEVERVEAALERTAPGFGDAVVARHVQSPDALEEHDANLENGSLNGGTASLHQQLVFRPTTGLGRPETPVRGLFLASASAHPGGGVHGACGWNAARAALNQQGLLGGARAALVRTAWERVLDRP